MNQQKAVSQCQNVSTVAVRKVVNCDQEEGKLVCLPEGFVLHIAPYPGEGCRQGRCVLNTSSVNMDESRLPICSKNL